MNELLALMTRAKAARCRPQRSGYRAGWMRSATFPVLLFCAALLSLPSPAALADSVPVQAGHSAYWYNPERSGAGLVLEVLTDEQVVLYWFTYDEGGNPRWVLGIGQVRHDAQGAVIEFPTLHAPRGGHFGEPFNLGPGDKPVVGQASLRFAGCNQATFAYAAYGQSETIALQRLTYTMGSASCWPYNGVPGKPVQAYAGQSGSWYDPAHSGAGFSLQWLYNGQALLTWYTFDTQGDPYWIQGLGHYEGGQIVFPELYTTTGGRFAEAIDADDLEYTPWGSLTLTLDCTSGTAHYESILPAFGSGELDLAHLTVLKRPACPYVKPEFSDLYEVTWTELPIKEGSQPYPVDIADDGTIVAFEDDESVLTLWHPGASDWQTLDREIAFGGIIASDGNRVLATDVIGDNWVPVMWRENAGWDILPGLIFDHTRIGGASDDLSRVVGVGYDNGDNPLIEQAWIWDAEHGQRLLAALEGDAPHGSVNDDSIDGTTVASGHVNDVSSDGTTVVGGHFGIGPSLGAGWVWEMGQATSLIHDKLGYRLGPVMACDRECGIMFGFGQSSAAGPYSQHRDDAWFRTETDAFAYLPRPLDALPNHEIIPMTTTANGRIVVGRYSMVDGQSWSWNVFIWTQRTGMVSVRHLIHELGLGDDDWVSLLVKSISSDGDQIVLTGTYPQNGDPDSMHPAAAVLGLTPSEGD